MPSNVEVKVALAGGAARAVRRLKLREERTGGERRAELIGYVRRDPRMRTSRYHVAAIAPGEVAALKAALSATLPVWVVVDKRRELWLTGDRVRVHLDRVRALGSFLELESPTGDGAGDLPRARRRTVELLAALGLGEATPIPGSYSDLLARRGG